MCNQLWIELNLIELLLMWELMMCQQKENDLLILLIQLDQLVISEHRSKECYDFQFGTKSSRIQAKINEVNDVY